MGKTATNFAIALGLITVAFAGYYMFTQQGNGTLSVETNQQATINMLNNTQVFIEHRRALDGVDLDISIFEDPRFRSLRSFTTPIQKQPIGRPDPFADISSRGQANP